MSWKKEQWNDLVFWGVLGVVLGGRIGFVLFYEPLYFLQNPLEIFAVWKGGMSSHGGFVGVILVLLFVMRTHLQQIFVLGDIVTVPAALGLAIGRIGNLINQELYGFPTTLPWGITIPGVEGLRHPTALYSSLGNMCIAALCFWHLRSTKKPGMTSVLFLALYAVSRFLIEFLRVPSHSVVDVGVMTLTRGQVLSIMVLLSALLVWWLVQCDKMWCGE